MHRITDEQALAAVALATDPATYDRVQATLDADDAAHRAWLTRPKALAESAAWYAHNGLAVFPLVPGEKRPIVRRGLHEATTDPEQVAAWWQQWPQANIGLRTGLRFDVVDVDGPAGYRSLVVLEDDGLIPATLGRVCTARGGRHIYIAPTGDGNTAGLLPGIDYRGSGGYVVAPPSRTVTGMWTWLQPLDPANLRAAA